MAQLLITTIDNPFNPFTQFDEWLAFDHDKGYNTCEYLARIAKTSPELSDSDEEQAINDAVAEIARLNVLGIYRIVEHSEPEEAMTDVEQETTTI